MIRALFRTAPTRIAPPENIDGVAIRYSTRAKRMALRLDSAQGQIVLVLPARMTGKKSIERATAFVRDNRAWIENQKQKIPAAIQLKPGAQICVLGEKVTLAHALGRGTARIENGVLFLHGDPSLFSRRAQRFLKTLAEHALQKRSDEKSAAAGLGRAVVRVCDPRTRWGSCSADGRLMYSWRLILAPPVVMDYIVAHEVAHRVHHNHGRRFWALCDTLSDDMATARQWLRDEGASLMRVA